MAKTADDRRLQKWRLVQERMGSKGYVECELCQARPATDLHEIINRVHYAPELVYEMPDQLLSLICNHCNVHLADGRIARAQLFMRNIDRYGIASVREAVRSFALLTGGSLDPDIRLRDLMTLN